MDHDDHHQTSSPAGTCACGKDCITCQADNLSVNCGCSLEAKQYEYATPDQLTHHQHAGHGAAPKPVTGGMAHEHAGHSMPDHGSHGKGGQKMSHQDHEAAMSNPQMAKRMEADMRRRFWISFLLSIPIFLHSPVASNLLGLTLPSPIPINWLLFILTTPVVFWAGSIFITGTYYSLKSRKLNMSVLIATGVLAAYLFSVLLTFSVGGETFYEAAALLVTFVLFGHWMEMKSRRGTSDALRALFNLVPPQANVIREGKEITIPVAEVKKGDVVVLRPGDKVAVDGEVIEGETAVDESLITGESIPAEKSVGSRVIGGSINQSGSVRFRAVNVGSDTVLSQIIKLVETAQNSKAPGQRIADKAAAWLVIVAIAAGVLTFFGWYLIGGATVLAALTFAVSAIVIACPDALGLATPTAVAVGTGIGAKHNILIKDATTLEQVSKIQAVVLDKTGTLTKGQPKITDVVAGVGFSQDEILRISAAVEAKSGHPLSKAILEEAKIRNLQIAGVVKSFKSLSGLGVEAVVDGRSVLVGTEKLMQERNIDTRPMRESITKLLAEGKTLMISAVDEKIAGIAAAQDPIKATAKKAVEAMRALGLEVAMITGDNRKTAEVIAGQLGIERIFAEVLPEDKARYVKELQAEGKFVAMVGDGINDAPALAQADIGIAIGAGTDVAIETANVVLMKSDPYDILRAIILSKATVVKMKQNIFWAAIYNILAIPVAAGVFYPAFGISLRPEISALLMSASSIIVATNAVLLKRVESKLARG